MSELRVYDNQYIIHPAECENGANPMVMVEDCGEISAGYDCNKLIRRSKRQNVVPDRLGLSKSFDGQTVDTQSYYEIDLIHLWVFCILCALIIL